MKKTVDTDCKATRNRTIRCVMFSLAFFLLLLTQVKWDPLQFGTGLDPSWEAVLHHSFATGKQFGEEIVSANGPYGFADTGNYYYPPTFILMLIVQCFICLPIALVLERVIHLRLYNPWKAICWLITIILLISNARYFLGILMLLAYYLDYDRPVWIGTLLLAVALSLASLIKLDLLTISLCVLAALTLEDIFCRRHVPWLFIVYALSVVGMWIGAGQRLLGLFSCFGASLPVAWGYTEAMALWRPGRELIPYLATSVLLLAAFAAAGYARRRFSRLFLLAGLAGVLFVTFKVGFVRHEVARVQDCYIMCVTVVLLFLPVLWRPKHGWRVNVPLFAAVAIALCPWLIKMLPSVSVCTIIGNQSCMIKRNTSMAKGLLTGSSKLERQYRDSLENIKEEVPFPIPSGSVDIYSYDQSYVFANGWSYNPRPVFQSCSAYTTGLAELNAKHLRGPKAPDTIFFSIKPIDGRYPSLEDGLSWPELLTRYDIRGKAGLFLWLERAGQPRSYKLIPLDEVSANLGEEIQLPQTDNSVIWAKVDMKPTLFNHVAAFVFKSPLPTLTVNGESTFRLLPSLARGGFLLSPFVGSVDAFHLLAKHQHRDSLVNVLQVDADSNYYQSKFKMSLFRLEFPVHASIEEW